MKLKPILKKILFTTDVYTFMSYSLIFPKLIGLFSYDCGKKFNFTSYIMLTFYLSTALFAQYHAFKLFVFGTSYTWHFSKYMDIAELSLILTTFTLCLKSFLKKKSLIKDILTNISLVDRRLHVGRSMVTYSCYKGPLNNILRIIILLLKFMERYLVKLGDAYRNRHLYMLLAVDLPFLAIHFMNTPFLAILRAYSKHFANLKSFVNRLGTMVDDRWKVQMDHILLIYVKLYNSATTLNKVYSDILFFTVTCAYLVIVKHIYFVCYMCLKFNNKYKYHNLIISPLYIMLWSLEVYQISAFSAFVTKQSLEFNEELLKMANNEVQRFSRHRKLEIHLAFKPTFEFKGNKILKFDYGLICSVITTVATYIAMLVQFGSDWN